MNARGVCVRYVVVGLMVAISCMSQMVAQDGSKSTAEVKKNLANVIETDGSKGEWVFYRQRYIDADKRWVQYQGSVYAAVQNMKIEGCQINMETVVVDRFSGTVGNTGTGQQQDTSSYAISFALTPEIAEALQVVRARPAQLRRTTHAICDENPSCELTWVRIKEPGRKITERITTNDQIEFTGSTSTAVFPISSWDVGSGVVKHLQVLANLDCH